MYARTVNRPKQRTSQVKSFPAPIGGWISNRALASPQQIGEKPGAAVLDNFFPQQTTVVLRRGKSRYGILGDGSKPSTSLFSYLDGGNQRLFATTSDTVYDITNILQPYSTIFTDENGNFIVTENDDTFGWDHAPATPVITGMTGGAWIVVQFATTGGVFLVGVNGKDAGFLFDGTDFSTLAVTFAGTGLTPADMDYAWIYKSRLWFAQKSSMNAWYLPVDSIAGEAKIFPLGGIFGRGGSLLFGQTWSLDSGAEGGLSEQNIFVSTEGEVAIYQGDDPDVATAWKKVGLYRIGRPLGNRAWLRGGGDIAIATSVGLVPMSKAITLDITALSVATISYNIADAWTDAVKMRGASDWQCEIWADAKMAVISPPDLSGSTSPVLFVSNTETGAWARYTGWNALCMEVFQGGLYFGSADGCVYQANVSGFDDGEAFTGAVMPLFEDFGSPASAKVGKVGRVVLRARGDAVDRTEFHTDFDLSLPSPPNASVVETDNVWDAAIWGQAKWGETLPVSVQQDWRSMAGVGYACSISTQITSGATAPLDAEIIRFDLTYTTAEVVT